MMHIAASLFTTKPSLMIVIGCLMVTLHAYKFSKLCHYKYIFQVQIYNLLLSTQLRIFKKDLEKNSKIT